MMNPLLQRALRGTANTFWRQESVRTRRRRTQHHRRRRRRALVVAAGVTALAPFIAIFLAATAVMSLLGPVSQHEAQADDPCAELATMSSSTAAESSSATEDEAQSASVAGYDEEQTNNAKAVIKAGQKNNIPEYGWVIALATAIQESTLRNVGHGDTAGPDSRGLFQQRAAWGPLKDRMNPEKAAGFFFLGGTGGQSGLTDISGWEDMPIGLAAQSVQRSADPSGQWYSQHEPDARMLVEKLGDGDYEPNDCGGEAPMQCGPSDFGTEDGLTPDARLVMRCTSEQFPEFTSMTGVGDRPAGGDGDHAAGRAVDMMIPGDYHQAGPKEFGWKVARWVQKNHAKFGVKYLIYDKKIWSVARSDEGWRDYDHYADCTSDTCLHYDHVHVSVYGDSARSPASGKWIAPVEPGKYNLTARFGECGGNWGNCHTGLDFAASTGTPVHAASSGKVTFAGENGPYGNRVIVDHGNSVTTTYSHLNEFSPGVKGATVKPGTVIGYVGTTGNSTGSHLHFEVKENDEFQDPEKWLKDHGVDS